MPPLVTLRCQTIVDGSLAYVTMPIDSEVWDSADETLRDRLRSRARVELWHAVAGRTGQSMPHDCYNDLPVWEEHSDRCEVECVGGPLDGQRVTLSSAEPPIALQLPLPAGLPDAAGPLADPVTLLPLALYQPLRDEHGFLSRTADGAWRFSGP